MSKLLAGKLAFITGGGSGIGRETCRVFAREGAQIVATDQNSTAAAETVASLEGTGHVALCTDVSNRKSIETTFEHVLKQFSRPPTIIVNSAGITRDNFLVKLSDNNFEDVINVNLKGTFLVMQSAVKAMIAADATKNSSIINISSISGIVGNIGQSNYAASKAGVIAMTKTASKEFGQFGLRVNVVIPGFIDTSITATVPDKVKELFIKNIALKRIGKPQEVAEVIAFLASDKSSYVNGAAIEITGGMY